MLFEGRRVYLTGATGYIGGVLARRLLSEGAKLTCLVRPGTDARRLETAGAKVVRGDVTDADTIDVTGHGVVIHAAAWVGFGLPRRKRALFFRTNVDGTRNVLAAAQEADVARIVHVSSIAALGAIRNLPAHENSPRARSYRSNYEHAKTEAHDLALRVPGTAIPMPGVVVGHGGPFGPLIALAARGRLPGLMSNDATKGFVHVDDVADGIMRAALTGRGPYILVDENMRTTELLVAVAEAAGARIPRVRIPSQWVSGAGHAVEWSYRAARKTPPFSGELLQALRTPMAYDSAKARDELGWKPAMLERLRDEARALRHAR